MTRERKATMVGAYCIAGPFVRCRRCRVQLTGRRALKYRTMADPNWRYECASGCDTPEPARVGAPS